MEFPEARSGCEGQYGRGVKLIDISRLSAAAGLPRPLTCCGRGIGQERRALSGALAKNASEGQFLTVRPLWES